MRLKLDFFRAFIYLYFKQTSVLNLNFTGKQEGDELPIASYVDLDYLRSR